MEDSSRRTSISTSTSTHESVISATTRTTSTTAIPRIGNINSPSVSLASVSSGEDEIRAGNGSLLLRKGSSHDSSHELNSNFDNLAAVVDQLANMTMASSSSNSDLQNSELHVEVRRLKDSLARLRQVFEDCADRPDAIRKAAHERLGEVHYFKKIMIIYTISISRKKWCYFSRGIGFTEKITFFFVKLIFTEKIEFFIFRSSKFFDKCWRSILHFKQKNWLIQPVN